MVAFARIGGNGGHQRLYVVESARLAGNRRQGLGGIPSQLGRIAEHAIGVAKGHQADDLPYSHLLTRFVPTLESRGVTPDDVRRLLVDNPRRLLTTRRAEPLASQHLP